ncbi:MAG: prepilin-type N-terminal cleavage/methylation domain-containing protein [Fuerstiella sp.]|nr:prepilin-type N-terminal cleavage/methylation domain-containing protein [Fuerstiella sp.]MCP4854229.1 prepilin-type N-terminal cleavage/methylation domain-containing protein [Fuerstiella sp.]
MTRQSTTQTTRSGFTLLELLAVITIISILLALILPAIGGAMRNARTAEVQAEFSRLTTGITSFKSEFGLEPWSTLTLTEDPSATAWKSTSRTRLRRIWPQFNFTAQHDFNGDGDANDVLAINASECLVFFLGGVRMEQPNVGNLGFSKNPINPFTRAGENRTVPYEFDTARLVDTDNDGMLEYVDALPDQTVPLLYVSSNNGQGYTTANGSLNHYVEGNGKTAWKKSSFQIISPGEDGEFGFDPAPNPFVSDGSANDSRPKYSEDEDVSREEADNVASFKPGGTLGR